MFVLACGVVALSVIPFGCVFGDATYIIGTCATNEGIAFEFVVTKVGVAVDVLSDFIRESVFRYQAPAAMGDFAFSQSFPFFRRICTVIVDSNFDQFSQ